MKVFQSTALAVGVLVNLLPVVSAATECTDAGVLIHPAGFYGISSTSTKTTTPLGPYQPDSYFAFSLSQTGNSQSLQSEKDLVATYTNVRCGSVTVEFLFEPISDYNYGGNTKVDVYNIIGNLPRDANGKPVPTWDNLKGKTGSLVGSFTMPNSEATQVHKNFLIGKATCNNEVNLRLSISNTGYKSGTIDYSQDYAGYVTGLKLRLGK